jgi:uncharacterized protein YbjQ (UPF0145 family)
MIISTTERMEGNEISEALGLVKGNTIRARWVGRDIAVGLKTLVGGEIKSYTVMLSDAREEAISRMIEEAENYYTTRCLSKNLPILFKASFISYCDTA